MNVALIQLNAGINKKQNIQNTCANVEKAIDKGAEFILLPEIFNYRGPLTGIDLFNEIAEEIPGESLIPLMKLAKNAGVVGVWAAWGYVDQPGDEEPERTAATPSVLRR